MLNTTYTFESENWAQILGIQIEQVSVLIIGNNPIEITSIHHSLSGIRSKHYVADVCFNVKDSFDRIAKNKPGVILMDDNFVPDDILKFISILKQNPKTEHIRVIALKSANSNNEVLYDVDDSIFKDTLNPEALDSIIETNLKIVEKSLV